METTAARIAKCDFMKNDSDVDNNQWKKHDSGMLLFSAAFAHLKFIKLFFTVPWQKKREKEKEKKRARVERKQSEERKNRKNELELKKSNASHLVLNHFQ